MNESTNDRATFVRVVDEIRELAWKIMEAADGHFDADLDQVDAGWVDDVTGTRDRLAEIVARICGEEE
ncbi:MAG: hypothetical protein R3E97_24800 [Candidatus Eisenbacteria bacterium]